MWLRLAFIQCVKMFFIRDMIYAVYFCQTFTDDARLKNVCPLLDLTRILNSYHKRNDRRKFPEK